MNKGFVASSVLIIAAGALGFLVWPDKSPSPVSQDKSKWESTAVVEAAKPAASSGTEWFAADASADIIDLARVFEPTGEELELQYLLESFEATEYLPLPRVLTSREHAVEEASAASSYFGQLSQRMSYFIGWKCARLLNESQALMGVEPPDHDREGNRLPGSVLTESTTQTGAVVPVGSRK